jgi:hypothetical protein
LVPKTLEAKMLKTWRLIVVSLHMFAFITYEAIDNCGLGNLVKFCTLNEETCGNN